MISHKYRCIFIHQRKTAGSAIITSFGINLEQPEWHTFNEGVRTLFRKDIEFFGYEFGTGALSGRRRRFRLTRRPKPGVIAREA